MRLLRGPRRSAHLTPEARRVLDDLRRDGIASTDLAALLGSEAGTEADELRRGPVPHRRPHRRPERGHRPAPPPARRRPGQPACRPARRRPARQPPARRPRGPLRALPAPPAHQRGGRRALPPRRPHLGHERRADPGQRPHRRGGWTRDAGAHGLDVHLHLTQVQDGVGPLSYVRTSHRRGRRGDRGGDHLADRDVERAFGPGCTTTAEGRTGTVVFTDPRGLQRRARPTAGTASCSRAASPPAVGASAPCCSPPRRCRAARSRTSRSPDVSRGRGACRRGGRRSPCAARGPGRQRARRRGLGDGLRRGHRLRRGGRLDDLLHHGLDHGLDGAGVCASARPAAFSVPLSSCSGV